MKAIKENRVYTITEADKESFRVEGYDIYGDDGKLVCHGAGKMVSYDKYYELSLKYDALMEENARLTGEIEIMKEKKSAKTPKEG